MAMIDKASETQNAITIVYKALRKLMKFPNNNKKINGIPNHLEANSPYTPLWSELFVLFFEKIKGEKMRK